VQPGKAFSTSSLPFAHVSAGPGTGHRERSRKIYLKLDDPAHTAAVVEEIKKLLPDYYVLPLSKSW